MTDSTPTETTRRAVLCKGGLLLGSGGFRSGGRVRAKQTETPTDSPFRWGRDVSFTLSRAAHRDGTLYVSNGDGIDGIDLETGERRRVVGLGEESRAGWVTLDGQLLVNVQSRRVEAVDIDTGDVRWTYGGDRQWLMPREAHFVGDRVVLSTDRREFVGLDRATGEVQWRYEGINRHITPPFGTVVGETLVFDNSDGTVVALNVRDGSVRWRNSTYYAVGALDDTLYATDQEYDLLGVNVATGRPTWSRAYGCASMGWPVAIGGTTILPCGRSLRRLDEDHNSVWRYESDDHDHLRPVGGTEGRLFVSQGTDLLDDRNDDQYSNLAAVDRESGKRLWKFTPELEGPHADRLGHESTAVAHSGGAVAFAAGKRVRLLDPGGAVRARHEVDFQGLGGVTYPPAAEAAVRGGVILTRLDRRLTAFDAPDWEPTDSTSTILRELVPGAAALAVGAGAWLAYRRNRS